MFDNLRDFSDTPLYEDDQNQEESTQDSGSFDQDSAAPVRKKKRRKSKNFLGMTAQQRLIISVMLMFTVCLLGTLVMFVTGRMSIF